MAASNGVIVKIKNNMTGDMRRFVLPPIMEQRQGFLSEAKNLFLIPQNTQIDLFIKLTEQSMVAIDDELSFKTQLLNAYRKNLVLYFVIDVQPASEPIHAIQHHHHTTTTTTTTPYNHPQYHPTPYNNQPTTQHNLNNNNNNLNNNNNIKNNKPKERSPVKVPLIIKEQITALQASFPEATEHRCLRVLIKNGGKFEQAVDELKVLKQNSTLKSDKGRRGQFRHHEDMLFPNAFQKKTFTLEDMGFPREAAIWSLFNNGGSLTEATLSLLKDGPQRTDASLLDLRTRALEASILSNPELDFSPDNPITMDQRVVDSLLFLQSRVLDILSLFPYFKS